jgi:acetyl-CoA carboxylase carboxyl transferase subunit beta
MAESTSDTGQAPRNHPAGAGGEGKPEGRWLQCPRCREILFTPELERNLKVCRKCGHHFRLTARERVELLLDAGSFVERDASLVTMNPLEFDGYAESLRRYQDITQMPEAVLSGEGRVDGCPVTIAVTDSHFLMGSMASVVGERVTRAVERATEQGIASILVSGSGGGARMQEGLLSLMQMAKTSGAIARHHHLGLLLVVVLTDPSMAGVLASWGSLGDFILAEPGAMIGFVGQRVSLQAGVTKMPADFQTAEFQLKHGQIDRVCHRRELKETVSRIVQFAGGRAVEPVEEVVHGR